MSNAVDILCVGGPASGRLMCQPRPVPNNIEVFASGGGPTFYMYATQQWTNPVGGKKYWIAKRTVDTVSDSAIAALILAEGMPPSWDLNR